jgi:hypothetical protein
VVVPGIEPVPAPTLESTVNDNDGIINIKPGAALLWDTSYLSSLKETFQSQQVPML